MSMPGTLARWAVGATILALAAMPALAQPRAGRHALIVGVGQYGDAAVSTLSGVPHDIDSARAIAGAMGVPAANMTVLRDGQATQAGILQALDRLAREVRPGDRVFVYFSGHGTRWYDPQASGCVEGLYPYDGKPITHAQLAEKLRPIGQAADKLLTMVDACHSGGVVAAATRGLAASGPDALAPKFFTKAGQGPQDCSRPANHRTRGLFDAVTRLGAIGENTVEIAAARPDEQSYDEPGRGGLATQGLRDCLLGRAKDLDGSGAVSLDEIRACAQRTIDDRMARYPKETGLLPHTITIRGARNLIPVAAMPAPVAAQPASPAAAQPASPAAMPSASAPTSVTAAVQPPAAAAGPSSPTLAAVVSAPPPQTAGPAPASQTAGPAPASPSAEFLSAPLATLRDLEAQADVRHVLQVGLPKRKVTIGRDDVRLTVKSSRGGYLYVLLLGSDRSSFYLLYPNAFDRDNRIAANATVALPGAGWAVRAAGPPGVDEGLVIVADSPRDLAVLSMGAPGAASPFAYAVNDAAGRANLLDLFAGSGLRARSEGYGVARFRIEEVRP